RGPAALDEIVVTAEHRAANIQDTPIAITAVSGDTLEKRHTATFEAIASSLPNVQFSEASGVARIFIRGVGLDSLSPGSDPRVAVYTDQIYNARTGAAFQSLFDIDRIEVLNGPQGTLYGRNATAGAINILSRDPGDTLNGYGTLTIGNYDLVQTEGAIGGPLSDTISARIAFQTVDRAGFGKHIETGADIDDAHRRAVRAKLRIAPSEDFTIALEADYSRKDDRSGAFHFLKNAPGYQLFGVTRGFVAPSNVRDYAGNGPSAVVESYGGGAIVTGNLGDYVLTSVTGFRHFDSNFFRSGGDQTTSNYLPARFTEDSDQLTQELRLAASFGPVDALIGGYVFHERNKAVTRAQLNGAY
ncbi:MAG: TonB-dependent receptor, partial [Thermomicrobiales bacterium]